MKLWVKVILGGARAWMDNQVGKKLKRGVRAWRNRRRAKRGEAPLSEDEAMNVPQNTLRKGGVAFVALAPVVAAGLSFAGVGECTPEEAEMGCVGAQAIAASIMSIIGGGLYWIGRNRAEKRE